MNSVTRAGWLTATVASGLGVMLAGCGGNVWSGAGFNTQLLQGSQSTGPDVVGPCDQPGSRRLVRITLQNATTNYIHYFMHLIAEAGPTGSVCESDVDIYTAFGFIELEAGQPLNIGGVVFQSIDPRNRWLWYFHEFGSFRVDPDDPTSALAAAIAPASSTGSTTVDAFWINRAAPVPDFILFDDRTSALDTNECNHKGFYYTDADGTLVGSSVPGAGSAVRTTAQIQGTRCECQGQNDATQSVTSSAVADNQSACFQFPRGARIIYTFLRQDTSPAVPQLIWRVFGATGEIIHEPPAGLGF